MALDASFVLIEGDWPCDRAHRLLTGVPANWVVVHRVHQGEDLYYTFKHGAVLVRLPVDGTPVGEALNLHESDAAPTRAADTPTVRRPTVVVNRGLVAGVARPIPQVRGLEGLNGGTTTEVSRAVRAGAPPQVAVGDTVSLVVELSDDLTQPGTLPLTASVDETIDVVVQASGGLEIVGRSDGELKVTQAGTSSLLFKVKGRELGPGQVTVHVFRQGQGVGQIPVSIRAVQQVTETNPETAAVRIEAGRPPPAPDLQLFVQERASGGEVTYEMRLTAADPGLRLNLAPFGPVRLPKDPQAFFKDFYADVEEILTSAGPPQQKLQRLATKGDYLFDKLVPPAARDHLWKLRARIRSVQVQSEDPWIPWELIKLSGDDGTGTIEAGDFLCKQFEVTRWVPGLPFQHELTLNDIGVVTPGNSGLAAAVPERNALLALASPTRQVTAIDADEVTLRNTLASGALDAIHFTGHGIAAATNADRAEIRLEQGSRLRPEDLTGVVANLGRKKHPLVFLNACEIGRAGMGLNSPGGWPRGFLNAGAGAFIGPFWKVLDGTAANFASAFYQGLINGESVGKAALDARKQIEVASDPTWLAYSVYAHPDARLRP